MTSLLQACILNISNLPTKESLFKGLPVYLTDQILDLILLKPQNKHHALLTLRLWSSYCLSIATLYIRDSIIDNRFISALNVYGPVLKQVSFERCEFEEKTNSSLQIDRLEHISFSQCCSLTDKLLSSIFGIALKTARYISINQCPFAFQSISKSLAKQNKRLVSLRIDSECE